MNKQSKRDMNAHWTHLLVEELLRSGVGLFVISPGSRSTPLTVAVAQRCADRMQMHFDERGAAFYALGWAKATGKPAAVVSTSGSAVANYWPAVVEASAARVPLILLTADRPPELLCCGANQAIQQSGIYGAYVRWQVDMPCPDAAIAPSYVLTTVDQAVYKAMRAPAGPVHVNCMFREPLAPTSASSDIVSSEDASMQRWSEGHTPYTQMPCPLLSLSPTALASLQEQIQSASRGVLLAGQLHREEERRAVRELARHLDWPLLTDVTSGLRLKRNRGTHLVYYDQLLLSELFREFFQPDFVLHLGGAMTSKRLAEHLHHVGMPYCHIAEHPDRQDPLYHVSQRYEANLEAACEALCETPSSQTVSSWSATALQGEAIVETILAQGLDEEIALSEIALARKVSGKGGEAFALFLGNSMPVRDMDMYGLSVSACSAVTANRGASGIDGCVASAAGYARGQSCPTIAILGDLATLHDLNSLALLRKTNTPVALIVINNDGGGIFSFLPIAEHENVFESCFATPHGMGFEAAAQQFGLRYAQPKTEDAFDTVCRDALKRCECTLIEVRTDRVENAHLHRTIQLAIQKKVDEEFSSASGKS